MALLWQARKGAMTSVPGVQLRTRRPFPLTLSLVFLITTSGILAFYILAHLHNGFCEQPSLLASSGLCYSFRQSEWNLFYHLGGNGPWIRKTDGLYYYDAPLPKKCSVDQVHMVSIPACLRKKAFGEC
jgi:hypothetical protein